MIDILNASCSDSHTPCVKTRNVSASSSPSPICCWDLPMRYNNTVQGHMVTAYWDVVDLPNMFRQRKQSQLSVETHHLGLQSAAATFAGQQPGPHKTSQVSTPCDQRLHNLSTRHSRVGQFMCTLPFYLWNTRWSLDERGMHRLQECCAMQRKSHRLQAWQHPLTD